MGASTGGIALGSPHNSVWLHTSVWEKSPPLRRGSADSIKQRLQGFCSTTRTFRPPTDRSDRGNTSVGHRTRVLQPLLLLFLVSKGEQCLSPSHSPILALPDLVLGANSPLVSVPLGDYDQAGLAVPASGQDLASSTRALEVMGMAHTGPRAVMDILPVEVQETITSARAPATRKLYSSKWGVFESWCLALSQLMHRPS